MHRDYLGSTLALSNSDGEVVEQRRFGAWGTVDKFFKGSGEIEFSQEASLLNRGYTGHEHFIGVALIHMNGRMYDAKLGRFLSPDNYIQEPYSTQSFNRYGYVWNNPLSYIDPSGEIPWLIPGLVLLGYIYLKGSHDNKDENGNWNWNPFTWTKFPGFGIGASSNGDKVNIQPYLDPTGTGSNPIGVGPKIGFSTGGEEENVKKKNEGRNTNNFSIGESPFFITEKTVLTGGEFIIGSYGSLTITTTKNAPINLKGQSISSSGFALGIGIGTPVELFSKVTGQIYFDQPFSGSNMRDIFKSTSYVQLVSATF